MANSELQQAHQQALGWVCDAYPYFLVSLHMLAVAPAPTERETI